MKRVILSADSTCDLTDDLIKRYNVNIQPLHINLDEQYYRDGVDISPDDIYATYQAKGILPKTSAPNPIEYIDHFKQWTDQGFAVVHISLGSGISSSHQNSLLAAEELPDVYVIDSGNLSTGMGLLVIEAAERIERGMEAAQIYQEINQLRDKVRASFVIDKLTYLYEGGRCSALANISANLLNIKPSIKVDNESGKMTVGKKYRGSLPRVLKHYTDDQLQDEATINKKRIFITHSGTDQKNINTVKELIEQNYRFEEILITRAGCTISSHCGPNTLGVLFMEN
ncbi:DegV family protein [Amphibacillus indicireducens]|uniref:DegV family protein n=1 Tax=Amphibacillus indicireducens TaxID=1076330 RepID=A0ABP7V0Z6_9BACI